MFAVELRHLIHFKEVATTLSMADAARRLGLTQPALTRTIQHIESVCGVPLFKRKPTGLELTRFGREMLESSSAFISKMEDSILQLEAQQRLIDQKIVISTDCDVYNEPVQATMAALTTLMPEVEIVHIDSFPGSSVDRLRRAEIDILLTPQDLDLQENDDLACTTIPHQRVKFLVPRNGDLGERVRRGDLDDLARLNLAVLQHEHANRGSQIIQDQSRIAYFASTIETLYREVTSRQLCGVVCGFLGVERPDSCTVYYVPEQHDDSTLCSTQVAYRKSQYPDIAPFIRPLVERLSFDYLRLDVNGAESPDANAIGKRLRDVLLSTGDGNGLAERGSNSSGSSPPCSVDHFPASPPDRTSRAGH